MLRSRLILQLIVTNYPIINLYFLSNLYKYVFFWSRAWINCQVNILYSSLFSINKLMTNIDNIKKLNKKLDENRNNSRSFAVLYMTFILFLWLLCAFSFIFIFFCDSNHFWIYKTGTPFCIETKKKTNRLKYVMLLQMYVIYIYTNMKLLV